MSEIPKERKLLQAPDFVRDFGCGIVVYNDKYQQIFVSRVHKNNDGCYALFDSSIRSDVDRKDELLCGFKKCEFKELKKGEIFVHYLRNISIVDGYSLIYNNEEGHYDVYLNNDIPDYENKEYTVKNIVYKVVPLSEADVYEEE